jgi:hypothetical protein
MKRSRIGFTKTLSLLLITATFALGGTVSPQLSSMPPKQSVQVIVQYAPSLVGSLLSTVCVTLNLIALLPAGELCSTTVAGALGLAQITRRKPSSRSLPAVVPPI